MPPAPNKTAGNSASSKPAALRTRRKKAAPEPAAAGGRPVVYPEYRVTDCSGPQALTARQAMELLGWEEASARDDGCVPELATLCGKHVRLLNNLNNQPLRPADLLLYKQQILRRQWAGPSGRGGTPNGSNVLVGRTGTLVDGQHRLIALVLAWLEWLTSEHWKKSWPTEPVVDTLVTYGVDETPDLYATMNAGIKSTFADLSYRSGHWSDKKAGERKALARLLEHAVRKLWDRTGARRDPYSPHYAVTEAADWVRRHPRVLRAVRHVWEENAEGKVSNWVSPGYAAALLYLQGCSASDPAAYAPAGRPAAEWAEGDLDWSLWDRACEYWVDLKTPDGPLKELRYALAALRDSETGGGGTAAEALALLARAWWYYRDDKSPAAADLELAYTEPDPDTGARRLDEYVVVGGIDLPRDARPAADLETPPASRAAAPPSANDTPAGQAQPPSPNGRPAARARGSAPAAETPAARLARLRAEAARDDDDAPARTLAEEWKELKAANPGRLLLFYFNGSYHAYEGDARDVARVLKTKAPRYPDGLVRASFPEGGVNLARLQAAGLDLAVATRRADGSGYQAADVPPEDLSEPALGE